MALALLVGCESDADQTPDPSSSGSATDTGDVSSTGESSSTGSGTTSGPDGSTGEPEGTTTGGQEVPWEWDLPEGFPEPWVPEDNPMSQAKVELGRHLFYDPRLSANETQSCSSCHEQALAFADGKVAPQGSTGAQLVRNSLHLGNAPYAFPLTWVAPTLPTLEDQLMVPIFGEDPIELGATGHEQEILDRFAADPLYQDLFAQAFPEAEDPYTFDHIIKALACFVRTMISGNSPFDRYSFQGDTEAMSESALRGMELFFSERLECHHCHGGFNFTLSTKHAGTVHDPSTFANNGLYNIGGKGDYPLSDQGLINFTFEPADMGKFRSPSLRNIAVTAPYMHDGSIATLEEVIAMYERGGRLIDSGPQAGDGALNPYKSGFVTGFALTDQERADLLAFLESLTDEDFLTDPRFSDPFE